MTNEEAVLWGLERAAKELKLSVAMTRILADRKELPSLRDSSMRRLFLPQDVMAFKQQREQVKKANSGKRKLRLQSKE